MTHTHMLTIQHHREIAHRLTDPRLTELAYLVISTAGTSSRASKQAHRLLGCMMKLRCELEHELAVDHPQADHTGIYWPQP